MAAMTGTSEKMPEFSHLALMLYARPPELLTGHCYSHVGTPRHHQLSDILELVHPDPIESLEERFLPCHELDDFHPAQ